VVSGPQAQVASYVVSLTFATPMARGRRGRCRRQSRTRGSRGALLKLSPVAATSYKHAERMAVSGAATAVHLLGCRASSSCREPWIEHRGIEPNARRTASPAIHVDQIAVFKAANTRRAALRWSPIDSANAYCDRIKCPPHRRATSQDFNGDLALILCCGACWTGHMVRRWHADPFGFLRPWNEVPALMGSAPPATPPSSSTGVVVCLMG
jgi:hypothetical protein